MFICRAIHQNCMFASLVHELLLGEIFDEYVFKSSPDGRGWKGMRKGRKRKDLPLFWCRWTLLCSGLAGVSFHHRKWLNSGTIR